MGSGWSIATGILLLGAVAFLADGWQTEPTATLVEAGDAPCKDAAGRWNAPAGMVVGGPADNTDEEPYRSFMAKCGAAFLAEQDPAPAPAAPAAPATPATPAPTPPSARTGSASPP